MGFSCDLCRGVGSSDQWLYRCVSCQFDVHLHCASVKMPHPPPPPPLQHHHSFPNQFVAPPLAAQPLTRSMSVGHVQRYTQPLQTPAPVGVHSYRQAPHPPAPVGVQSYRLPQQPPAPVVGVQSYQLPQQPPAPVGVQSYPLPQQPPAPVGVQSYRLPQQPPAPVGVQSYQLPPQPPAPVGVQSYRLPPQPALPTLNIGLASGLGTAMVTRFVEGTMQQLGQNFIQDLTGGGGGSGGDICGDGGDMLLEIIQQDQKGVPYFNETNSVKALVSIHS
ncbi:hypothetical protein L6452_34159 [Arctium lappa]|uniref:Uncharacterized protein n=1 Tax=Arctium lappa TaxID=4217 RepID=A0ACB8YIM3_ARCLA|nr:hypothetical protein L6452_34159 [Arctium lappa]